MVMKWNWPLALAALQAYGHGGIFAPRGLDWFSPMGHPPGYPPALST